MIRSVAKKLDELCAAVELLEAELPRLTRQEQIDLCARLVACRNAAERIEKEVKTHIRTWRGGPDHLVAGYVRGEAFRAYLNLFPVTRLDQGALQVNHPRIFGRFLHTNTEHRITFMAR